ncbi:AAA family ATPase [Salinibacterium sp. dk2585]|uniref:ATP-dependent nuclease n=1 Tax=unclassified Salinibacterium TaxID=2632331 RepID=UPI0011C24284|nr:MULTISPECIES: ATP-binding protein [unclassified Salinibacterium]QEE62032.1 AAA family ATPase [Salinibacterium sp. dk2585]TXK54413.1 AAA family ATPase [Salinibacterium sp. dk5596]
MTVSHGILLTKLKIEKFRAIGHAEVDLQEATALVGQNGSGKSSVLRALNAFFNFEDERADFEAGRHAYQRNTGSRIEILIDGLSPDAALPFMQVGANTLRARFKFTRQKPSWDVFAGGQWHKAPDGFREALRKQISFALVPTRRDHEVAHGAEHGLLGRAAGEWIAANRQRDRVSPRLVEIGASLKKNALTGFQKQLRKVAPVDGPFSFELDFASDPDYRLLLPSLAITVKEGGQSIRLEDSGSGTQSMAIFALYAYLAEIEGKVFILGMEEPEQNLHPQAQRQLMKNIIGMGLQVVFTTHSPTIVDTLEHEQVVLCRRAEGKARGLESRLSQVRQDFFTRCGIDRDSYYRFHRRQNSEFLFADFVVVVEGPADAAVVSTLLDDAGVDATALGINIVTLDGVTSIGHMYHLMKELDVASAYIVDKDYFLPYIKTDRAPSLDAAGYPQYRPELKAGTLLPTLFPKPADQTKAVKYLHGNHTEAMKMLRSVGVFCFRYALEIDLVAAQIPRSRLYAHLRVSPHEQTENHLLKQRYSGKGIKSVEAIVQAISGLSPTALPNSFKAIRREIPIMAAAARKHP